MRKYIAPFDMFGGKVKKNTIFEKYINNLYYPIDKSVFGIPKEIVETWEEYVEFKKGDFVTVTDSHRSKWVIIYSGIQDYQKWDYLEAYLIYKDTLEESCSYIHIGGRTAKLAIIEEKELLISKLKEQGKYYDVSSHSIKDINLHQEMIDEWKKSGKNKIVQFRHKYTDGEWINCHRPTWTEGTEYRFKPEPHFAPFTFEDSREFRDKWVKYKDNDYSLHRIYHVFKDVIRFGPHNNMTYQQAFDSLVFEDGSKFGKLVKE